ncbi:MAG: N-acetylmuramoyl-L-alanine amidase [Myxococcales bacterium]|nr:N-acetylmuramoyl-L-alanine amidase [Myxococcales bacterium]
MSRRAVQAGACNTLPIKTGLALARITIGFSLLFMLLTHSGAADATPTHVHGELPAHLTEVSREIQAPWATVRLEVDWRQRRWLEEATVEAVSWYYIQVLRSWDVRHVRLLIDTTDWVGRQEQTARWQSITTAIMPRPPVPKRPWETRQASPPRRSPAPAVLGQPWVGAAKGALSGKTVYLSPGHGWYWNTKLKRWTAQRPNTHDIVEDFVNAEAATHYLVPLLRNAGATVVGVRELDRQPNMALIDDSSVSGYGETGAWQTGQGAGFAGKKSPYSGSVNPFALGSYRATKVSGGKPTAVATWTMKVKKPGLYTVYVGYTAGNNRAADAHYEVIDGGGSHSLRIDQRRHGQTWTALGQYWFKDKAVVRLHNDSKGQTDKYVVADVVRIGGGMGEIIRGNGKPPASGPTSERPRWEECSRYYAQYAGAPSVVWNASTTDNNDDVSARSRFAAWHHETGEDAVYLSWHSNAASGPARGTSTYVYGPNKPNGSKNYQGVKGSTALGTHVQNSLVADIRAQFDPAWKDRGLYSAYFGEVNPSHNPEMPAVLVEGAFHSTKADADFLREPRFRHAMARAMVKGIIKYFAERDKTPVLLPPSAPTDVRLTSDGVLTWKLGKSSSLLGDSATSFVVQQSADGRAFDAGLVVKSTTATLTMPKNNKPLFARVVALNAGGASLPSSVVGASAGCGTGAEVLWVDGFTRLQASQLPVEKMTPWDLGSVQRLRQDEVNTFDYAAEWVDALAISGRAVTGMARSGFASAPIPQSVRLVVWAAGEQSTNDGVLIASERHRLTEWLQLGGGRSVILSGSEVMWALDKKGSKASADWLATWFGARYEDDDAGVYSIAPAAGSTLAWAGGSFDDGTHHAYNVDWPDVLKLSGATAVLSYTGGAGVAAAHYQVGDAATLLLGFPVAALYPTSTRRGLVAAMLTMLKTPAAAKAGCGAAVADGADSDAGATDAGTTDAGTPTTDAGSRSGDGGATSLDGLGQLDGWTVDGGAGGDLSRVPPDDGCGCNISSGARRLDSAPWWLLALCLSVLFYRRRWRCVRVHCDLSR